VQWIVWTIYCGVAYNNIRCQRSLDLSSCLPTQHRNNNRHRLQRAENRDAAKWSLLWVSGDRSKERKGISKFSLLLLKADLVGCTNTSKVIHCRSSVLRGQVPCWKDPASLSDCVSITGLKQWEFSLTIAKIVCCGNISAIVKERASSRSERAHCKISGVAYSACLCEAMKQRNCFRSVLEESYHFGKAVYNCRANSNMCSILEIIGFLLEIIHSNELCSDAFTVCSSKRWAKPFRYCVHCIVKDGVFA